MFLALKSDGERTSIRELTKKVQIPYHFLAKILQDLTYKGLLVSRKGPTGGFALAKSAKEITLFDIIDAIDGSGFTQNCILGFSECSGNNPCAVHEKWGSMREELQLMLVSKNIAQMAKETKKSEYR